MCQSILPLEISLLRSALGAENISYHSLSPAAGGWRESWSCSAVVPMALAGIQRCAVSWQAAPRVAVDPAQTPALPLRGFPSSKTSGFPALLGRAVLGWFPTALTSLPCHCSHGMWREDGQIFPTSAALLWAACTSQRRQHWELWVFPPAEGIQPRSPDLTSSHKNRRISTCAMGMMQTKPSVGAFHEFPSHSQLPSILLSRVGQCWDTDLITGVIQSRRRSINPFATRR